MTLEREIATYRNKLPELLEHKGKFVVIIGEEVIGILDSLNEALQLGYERTLDQPFLARQIQETEPVLLTTRSLRQR